jgi:hypothetical protein
MKVIILLYNICLTKNKNNNGNKWMNKIESQIIFLNSLIKLDTFHFMKNLLTKDLKDAWIYTYVQELKREELI